MLKMITVSLFVCALVQGQAYGGDDVQKRIEASQKASRALVKELGGALKKQLKAEGPVEAIKVCRDLAPGITGRISNANGWQMTRVSMRYRNSLLGMPDAWELATLRHFEKRKQAGEDIKSLSHYAVVTDPAGRQYFRFMKALPTKEVCLTCHGSKDTIPAAVQKKLRVLYPMDQATGFAGGDIRGAISIKQPMDVPLVK